MIKTVFSTVLLILSLSPRIGSANDSPLKAVMQINNQNVEVVIRGLKNALEISEEAQTAGTKLDLRLVVFGPAIDLFETSTSPELRSFFQTVSKRNDVHFFACDHTLKRIHKAAKHLLPGFTVIPSGPYEVLKLQRDGYLYIKP